MAYSRYEFREVTTLVAGAEGVPGNRRFYLQVGQGTSQVRLWMEKEQLQSLGEGAFSLISSLLEKGEVFSDTIEPIPSSNPDARHPLGDEFRVRRMGLSYDERRRMVAIFAFDAEQQGLAIPRLSCSATPAQIKALREQIIEVLAAGRPICVLCGGPMDPEGHACARRNGHYSIRSV